MGAYATGSNGGPQLLGSVIGLNMNTTADTAITFSGGSQYIITDFIVNNPSTNLSTADVLQLNSAPSRGGTNLAQIGSGNLTKLVGPNNYVSKSNVTIFIGDTMVISNAAYLSLTTAQGAPATANVYIMGYVMK